uniref:Renalase-like n=1 Tax=Crassostrea virginica TaxID=6565 RepID=A0A8B8CUQ5_CRAVI|nr:renalase-like [Crassostrea virginica]
MMIKTAMERIGIVGAGMTGATVASLLRADYPGSKLVVLDKGRGVGGRMSTSRSMKANSFSVDMGAQYISISEPYKERHGRFHKELITAGVLAPLRSDIEGNKSRDPTVTHHVAPQGVSSIVKHFLNQSGAELHTSEQIIQVDVKGDKVELTTESGERYQFDSVVLTMPVPQILQLQGTIADIINSKPEIKQKLEQVSYSARFAVGLFYNPNTKLSYTWGGKYIPEDPCIRFVAIENIKRGLNNPKLGPSVVVHTNGPFGLEHLEQDKNVMVPMILQHLRDVLPELPEPDEIKGHKWRFSQVHKPYEGSPGCVVLNEKPLIVLAGDAFSRSTMDGCIESALCTKDALQKIPLHKV